MLIAVGLALAAGVVGWVAGSSSSGSTKTVTVASGTTTGTSAAIDPHVAAGGHIFVQFACAQCHGDQGRGGVYPAVPALTTVASSADVGPAPPDHQPWPRRVCQPNQAVHAGLGRGHLLHPGQRPHRVHPRRPAGGSHRRRRRPLRRARARPSRARCCTSATAASTATARTGSAESPTRSRRTRRSRRSPARTSATSSTPTEDHRRDPERQRDRKGADREHAALGRNHPARADCKRSSTT